MLGGNQLFNSGLQSPISFGVATDHFVLGGNNTFCRVAICHVILGGNPPYYLGLYSPILFWVAISQCIVGGNQPFLVTYFLLWNLRIQILPKAKQINRST